MTYWIIIFRNINFKRSLTKFFLNSWILWNNRLSIEITMFCFSRAVHLWRILILHRHKHTLWMQWELNILGSSCLDAEIFNLWRKLLFVDVNFHQLRVATKNFGKSCLLLV